MAERLSTLTGQLPQGVEAPVMTPLTSSTSVVFAVGLTSKDRSLMDLRTIADWTLKPRILAIPGVSKVAVLGGEVKQFQVQINPDRLIQYNLGIEDVINAAQQATAVRGAGFVENENQRITLQTQGQPASAEAIGKTIVVHKKGANS